MNFLTNLFAKDPTSLKLRGARRIFLDYASATPVLPEVLVAMEKYWSKDFYNPNAIYEEGVKVKMEVEKFRKQIAEMFGAAPENVIFTSGGTEANVLVIKGVKPGKIIIEPESHPSVSDAAKGITGKELVLVSSVTIDNKLGRNIREERKKKNSSYPLLHIDASQTAQYFNTTLEALACDLITLDAAKLYGPKGVGAIILRRGVKLELPPLGTPPVPLIAGFVKALEVVIKDREAEFKRLSSIAGEFADVVKEALPHAEVEHALPNIVNISVPGILPEYLVLALDRAGVMASAGPACNSNKPEPPETPVRISLGRFTTESEAKKAAEIFCLTCANVLKSLHKVEINS
ncbi:MAG: aminotransferase class V-fold PLP-dependent enzyme [Candidatus Zambryskibacteria bacterium]|nr:aminotransferase class V-fold PLP-dependent enzyme [Candidatus Zambryskibacteria bacterium]